VTWRARIGELVARAGLGGLAIAVLLVLLAVQTVRIEGLSVWPLHLSGWKPRAIAAEAALREVAAAQELARREAESARDAAEQTYRTIAAETDKEADDALDQGMAAADRHIAAFRVRRPAAGDPSGGAPAPARDRGAPGGDRPGPPAELAASGSAAAVPGDWVAVTADDVRICTENTLRLEAARAWGIALEAESAAAQAAR